MGNSWNLRIRLPYVGTGPLAALLGLMFCGMMVGSCPAAQAREKVPVRISVLVVTGMPGGTYHRIGLGMASLWTTRLKRAGIRVSAAISEGSAENIEAIRIADADL
ncbi:MAG: hypothetical protein FJY85_03485, partial [Deltaproteobacteria bacterium]|nr:hypothetical protein [Deltaproteobacteria bacterium]